MLRCRNILFGSVQSVRHISNKEVIEKVDKYLCNNYKSVPVALVKGEGVYLWDADGKKYLDFLSGFGTNNFGHCHPKIVATLVEQAKKLHHVSRAYYNDCQAEYSEYVTKLFEYDKCLPMNTGVEGCDSAIKLARKWGYKKKGIPKNQAKVIFCQNNFWGRSIAAVSASTDPSSYTNYGPYVPGFGCVPYNNLEALERVLCDPTVCAFMAEPIQGEAGFVIPSEGYYKGIREICTEYNVLWIDDEVQAGMGRSGKISAVDYECVKPDIMVCAKALGGGLYPVSCALANDKIMMEMEPGTHGCTFGGNPLGCKIALTALKILKEENLAENAFKMGELFRKECSKELDKNNVTEVRGRGLLNAIVLKKEVASGWDAVLKLKENGVLTKDTKKQILRFCPPLTITEKEMKEGLQIIIKVINSLGKDKTENKEQKKGDCK